MKIQKIDGGLLREMAHSGLANLELNRELVDALNVFPVPDGDTGTNMALTMRSAVRELDKVESESASEVAEALSRGALKGARGNSGVILSQLFRGFYKAIKGKDILEAADLSTAFFNGVGMAYKAVMKPKEGTVLTVSRSFGEAAVAYVEREQEEADIIGMMEEAVAIGNETLSHTPDMLEALKQAGVVDSGGKGLMVIYEGWLYALRGEDIVLQPEQPAEPEKKEETAEEDTRVFGYHTAFTVLGLSINDEDTDRLKGRLEIIGGHVSLEQQGANLRAEVDTDMPGKALQYALRLGKLVSITVKNLTCDEPEEAPVKTEVPRSEYAMVTVAVGDGFKSIFGDLQVNGFVEGGQTMNPSTEDILEAIQKQNADCVYVLPNNGNIIMAARQAAELADCEVRVIPTKTVPQGLAAALAFNPSSNGEENEAAMTEASGAVKTGEITYAVRDSSFDGLEIHKDDIMGMNGKAILNVGSSVQRVALELTEKMYEGEGLITLYYGQDVTPEEAEALRDDLQEKYPDADVELQYGGQPLYYYILSLEE